MTSNTETPVLVVRSSTGIYAKRGPPSYDPVGSFPRIESATCKAMVFSANGQYFAWFDGAKISIVDVATWKIVAEIKKPETMLISFSPNGTYLNSWESFKVKPKHKKRKPNLFIWRSATGELAQSYALEKRLNWEPCYSEDDGICARHSDSQVLFYENGNFETPAHKIYCPKVEGFSLSSGSVHHVLYYMPGDSDSFSGKLCLYPELNTCVASNTFCKVLITQDGSTASQAEKVNIYWNNKGVSALLLTSTETGKTGASYSLHFLSTKGDPAIVLSNKNKPIYSVCWSPQGNEFCVLYDYMPAKATLFNEKCEAVFEFGSGPRNSIYFNPHGNLLLLGGFGSINGHVEVWDLINRRKIKMMTISDTTLLQWSPDGAHFVTANTAPQLSANYGFKIFHYSGVLLYERVWNNQDELWEVLWQAYSKNEFKKSTITFNTVEETQAADPAAKTEQPKNAESRCKRNCQEPQKEAATEADYEPTKLWNGLGASLSIVDLHYSPDDTENEGGPQKIQDETIKINTVVDNYLKNYEKTFLSVPENSRPFVYSLVHSIAAAKVRLGLDLSSKSKQYISRIARLEFDLERLQNKFDIARAQLDAGRLIEFTLENITPEPDFIFQNKYPDSVKWAVIFEFCLTKYSKILKNRIQQNICSTVSGDDVSEAVENVLKMLPVVKVSTEGAYTIRKEIWEKILIDLGLGQKDIQIIIQITKSTETDESSTCLEKVGNRYLMTCRDFVANVKNRSDVNEELNQIFQKHVDHMGHFYFVSRTKLPEDMSVVFVEWMNVDSDKMNDVLEIAEKARPNARIEIFKIFFNP